jgi:transposase-like protein
MQKLARLTPMGRLRMVRRLETGERLGEVAAAIDLSTTSVRRWWRRYQQDGIRGLTDRSSRPHRSPRALPRAQRRQITRRRQWGWSSRRIARDLQLPLPTVVHVQRRLGLARIPRPAPPPVQRYERVTPGELVHLDIKKRGRFRRVGHRIHGDHGRRSRGSGSEYLPIAIDDRTRLACAALFPDETAASATAFLAVAHRWFAARGVRVHGLLTDNGSAYRGRIFGALCGQLGLRHHRTRPYRALPAADQRQGRALHPHLLGGVGLSALVPHVGRAGERAAGLRAILHPAPVPVPHGHQWAHSHAATCAAPVNNVFTNYI